MKHLWRKLVSVILALAMVVLCLPEYVRPVKSAMAADGDVVYIDENGQKVVLNNKDSDSTNNYTALREPGPTEFKDGMTYVWGDGSMNYQFLNYASKRIEVNGHVKLVVLEGYTLHYAYGLHVPKGSSLTIYGGGSLSCTLQQNDSVSEKHCIKRLLAAMPVRMQERYRLSVVRFLLKVESTQPESAAAEPVIVGLAVTVER